MMDYVQYSREPRAHTQATQAQALDQARIQQPGLQMQPYPSPTPHIQYFSQNQPPNKTITQMAAMRNHTAGHVQSGSNVPPQVQMQQQLQLQQQHAAQPMPPFSIPSPPPASLPQKEAHTSERHTISEDRSAGSNLEVRNLAALKDRNVSQKSSEPMEYPTRAGFEHGPPSSSQSPREYAQLQQRFGRLRLDEEYPDENNKERDQTDLNDGLFPADFLTSNDYPQPQLVAKDDWVEDFEQADTSNRLQVDIEALQRHITEMQKQLSELEIQKQLHADKQFQIFYRIEGTSYFDHPEWTQGYRSIVSRIPVRNLDLFLERNKNVVFIVYRDFDLAPPRTGAKHRPSTPQHIRESIHPVSRQLRKTLEMMLKHDWRYESMFLELRRKREMDAPYLFIYHHRTYWKDILAHCPYSVRGHLNLVATYVSKNYGKEYMAADALFAGRKVSAEYIQYLFQPGDILVSRSAGQYRGLVARSWPQDSGHVHHHLQPPMQQPLSDVDSDINSDSAFDSSSDIDISETKMRSSVEAVEHERELLRHFFRRIRPGTASKAENNNKPVSAESSDEEFEVKIWQWSFDGDFKRVEGNIMLRLSQSTVNDPSRAKEWNMHDLDVYPLKFAPQSLVQKLRRRGMMFWKCRKRCLVSYHETDADAQDETDERFMIDFPTFRKLHSDNKSYVIHISVDTMTQAEMEQEEPPDKAFYYLVPLQTKGFNLRTKKWLDLNMDQIGPVVWNEKAFDSLVLDKDKKTKELITALVSKQIASSKSTDVVAGKGNGLILLLHGGPGTGKTLTAEGVAEIAKKPLYRVTCGDVGTKAEEVENYLESVLHLGKLWDCVVLLDEAEVFLERRSLDDLQRNALVSVFLRVIEYHEGILILTSNRVGTFDEAFRSRIQIAVHYPPLRAYQRLQIWKNFFDRLESFNDGSVDVDELREHLEELQEIEINGRQIRNAITTARQYADWKGKTMNFEHLKTALDVAARFNEYSEKLRGGLTDDQIAEDEGIR